MSLETVLLAGGLGTRLRARMPGLPKPMAPILGKPFLEYQLLALRRGGISRLVICTGYGAVQIQDYFGDGSNWGVEIRYSKEPEPLGTAGALKQAAALLDDRFQVLNGDTFVQADYSGLFDLHRTSRASATLAVSVSLERRAYGTVGLNSDGRIISFSEKEIEKETTGATWINAGLYIFERCVLDYIPAGRPVSLETETFPLLLARGEQLFGYSVPGYFVDIGTPDSYDRFQRDIKTGRIHVDS
jgi:mannose-1-phosphate guanylyltransferase